MKECKKLFEGQPDILAFDVKLDKIIKVGFAMVTDGAIEYIITCPDQRTLLAGEFEMRTTLMGRAIGERERIYNELVAEYTTWLRNQSIYSHATDDYVSRRANIYAVTNTDTVWQLRQEKKND